MKEHCKTFMIYGGVFIFAIVIAYVLMGALDYNSRFYGEWRIMEDDITESAEGNYIEFKPDMSLVYTFHAGDSTPLHGTYDILSLNYVNITILGEISGVFAYSFSSGGNILNLTDESTGNTMRLAKPVICG